MSDDAKSQLPTPRIRRLHWPIWLIWIVPILAAIIAIAYYRDYRHYHAKEIIIHFADAQGLKPGETPVYHLGVEVGTVSEVELSSDRASAIVHVALQKKTDDIARAGTIFWIERAHISTEDISGLSTVVSGPYIDFLPGSGPPLAEFQGVKERPLDQGPGLHVLVHADHLLHLQRNSPVYFRGIQVGHVEKIELNQDSSGVEAHLFIQPRYRSLVRADTKFWTQSGIDVSGGIFSGVKMNVESLRALISGGIAFATPGNQSAPSEDGWSFPLYEKPKEDWEDWETHIVLPPPTDDDQKQPEPKLPTPLKQAAKAAK